MPSPFASTRKTHLLTIHLEDYFQVGTLRSVIPPENWYRFETRIEQNTLKTLDLLDEFQVKATFFSLGWVADQLPDVLREVARRGHELASKGYYHRSIREMTPEEFRNDLRRSREAIEGATGTKVYGYRTARGWFGMEDLWALDILAEEGFAYDSSIRPLFRNYSHETYRKIAHQHRSGDKILWEFPLPTVSLLGWSLPIAGGNYHRQIPHFLMKRAVARWDRNQESPFLLYFHIWELDPNQPRIKAAPLYQRIRQYRNLSKMGTRIADYLQGYDFMAVADYLELPRAQPASLSPAPHAETLPAIRPIVLESGRNDKPQSTGADQEPITIVVPCFNEESSLAYLANTLRSVETYLADLYTVQFVFVDDNSTDTTWDVLNKVFGQWRNCKFLRHPRNLGVAAAILTGVRHSDTEIVCSIDCDCTYDPHQLREMIPLLEDGVDLVTASPYHPLGRVLNVPGWRLALSKSLSGIYGYILSHKLATYTSCFRVYRRSANADIPIDEGGFLGVAEWIAKLDLHGFGIREFPAVLEVRLLGQSKMRVLRTIFGHLKLLRKILIEKKRLSRNRSRNIARNPIMEQTLPRSESVPENTPNQGGKHHG